MEDAIMIVILSLISITLASINYRLGRILGMLSTIETRSILFARKRGVIYDRYTFSKN